MAIFHDMQRWSKDILVSSGAEILEVAGEPRTNHELGGCRMGSDPKTSVVNAFAKRMMCRTCSLSMAVCFHRRQKRIRRIQSWLLRRGRLTISPAV